MKSKTIALLVIVTAVLAAAALMLRARQQTANVGERSHQALFPELPAGEILAIIITGGHETVHLQRSDGGWTVAERLNYPADFKRVARLVEKAGVARVGRQFAASPEVLDRLGLKHPIDGNAAGASGVHVRMARTQGKPDVAEFLLGRTREAGGPGGGGQYVLTGHDGLVSLVDLEFDPLDQTSGADWIEKQLLNVDAAAIETIICRRLADGAEVYRLRRAAKGERPMLEGAAAPAGQRLLDYRVEQLFDLLGPLKISDVVGFSDASSNKSDGPLAYEFHLFDGARYTLVPGASPAGNTDKRSLRVAALPTPQSETDPLAAWVYLIESWQAELLVADREQFYEKSR